MYEIKVIATFSAAHSLRDYQGNCKNIHGHNWKVEVAMQSNSLDSHGMAIDFRLLKEETDKLLNMLDHTFLNNNPPFGNMNPTAENMARWIYETIGGKLNSNTAKVSRVCVWENDTSSATYS